MKRGEMVSGIIHPRAGTFHGERFGQSAGRAQGPIGSGAQFAAQGPSQKRFLMLWWHFHP
jgi:hypothetical protein